MTNHLQDIAQGERFEFGANWTRFLTLLDDFRVAQAEQSLSTMLGMESLAGRSFLDIGSGSGLFSLAARRLGANVHSFDYDPQSVACTTELKRRFFPDDPHWIVEQGSVLDKDYLAQLGQWDIVYSWGVLHHTGEMWHALENIAEISKAGGLLFLAIYNDQGGASRRWAWLKKIYNKNRFLRLPLACYTMIRQWGITFARDLLKGAPLQSWRGYKVTRGMSAWHDVVDWIGGYPFEVAMPEEIFYFFQSHGFNLMRLKTCAGGIGCNEFVFLKQPT
jgi:2-polyprenyl-6-hydroxyphenyl methylase/3-demethylubiquinone-9 3-methyltransferase